MIKKLQAFADAHPTLFWCMVFIFIVLVVGILIFFEEKSRKKEEKGQQQLTREAESRPSRTE